MENSWWLPGVVGSKGREEGCVVIKGQNEESVVMKTFRILTGVVDTGVYTRSKIA